MDIDFACTFTYKPEMTAYSAQYYGVLFRASALIILWFGVQVPDGPPEINPHLKRWGFCFLQTLCLVVMLTHQIKYIK